MKFVSGAILSVSVLAGFLAAMPSRAEDAPAAAAAPAAAPACEIPEYLLSGDAVLHFMVSISGILIMSAAAWLFSWYKHSADKSASRIKSTGGNADLAGGGL